MVHLVARNPISGKSCDLTDVNEDIEVLALKSRIESQLGVPSCCQILLFRGEVLQDDATFAALAAQDGNAPVQLDLVVTFEHLGMDLQMADENRKLVILGCLENWGHKGNPGIISAIVEQIGHGGWRVRNRATRALQHLTSRGDEHAIAALTELFTCERADSRTSAVSALGKVAERGDARSIGALVALISTDRDAQVRQEAGWAITEMAVVGDEGTVAPVLELLSHVTPDVRVLGAEVLQEVTRRGDPRCVAALVAQLLPEEGVADTTRAVQRAAALALSEVAPPGDADSLAALSAFLEEDLDQRTLESAVTAIIRLVEVCGDEHRSKALQRAISLVCARLEHASAKVRANATNAIACLRMKFFCSPSGVADEHEADSGALCDALVQVARSLVERLRDESLAVRRMAVKGLQHVGCGILMEWFAVKSLEPAQALSFAVEDEDVYIRLAATKVLSTVAEEGDADSVSLLLARCSDSNKHVREVAAKALRHLSKQTMRVLVEDEAAVMPAGDLREERLVQQRAVA